MKLAGDDHVKMNCVSMWHKSEAGFGRYAKYVKHGKIKI